MGDLTATQPLPIGSSIGEIASADVVSTNALGSSFHPSAVFAATGDPVMADKNAFQWDAGCIPCSVTTAAGGTGNFVGAGPINFTANKPVAVQLQVSVDSDFALANPSQRVRIAVAWGGGRTDSVDVNPANGAIIANSAGITSISSALIATRGGTNKLAINVFEITFVTPNVDPAHLAGTMVVTPNVNAGAGAVVISNPQMEDNSTFASAFISTGPQIIPRKLGTIPRLNVDTTIRDLGDGGVFTYVSPFHNRCTVFPGIANLPDNTSTIPPADGETIFIFGAPNGSGVNPVTVNVPATSIIAGSGLKYNAVPKVTSITLPWDGATPTVAQGGASLSNVTGIVLTYVLAVNAWRIMATTSGNAGGTTPVAGTITAGQVAFGDTTANTIKGDATLTYTTGAGGMALNNLLDISGAAGGQIKFPATQNPSANANTLDDYEEGTWTPSVGGTATYTVQQATYVKIGRLVTLTCSISINAIGTGSTSVLSGVPFTNENLTTTTGQSCGAVGFFGSITSALTSMIVIVQNNSASAVFGGCTAAQTTMAFSGAAIMGNGTRIDFDVSYRSAS